MGIFDALNTSVSGLQAQSFALQNISGNIANASTIGYKGIGTSFEDLVPQSTTPDRQVAGGVTAHAQATITTQGTVAATAAATNMAISGSGFFNIQKPIGITDNAPVFDGVTNYTRRGDFQLNGPSTVASSTASAGTLAALGGLNPADFTPGFNPQIIGVTGSAVNNKAAVPAPITGATTLSGAAGTDSLTANFAAGDTITSTARPSLSPLRPSVCKTQPTCAPTTPSVPCLPRSTRSPVPRTPRPSPAVRSRCIPAQPRT